MYDIVTVRIAGSYSRVWGYFDESRLTSAVVAVPIRKRMAANRQKGKIEFDAKFNIIALYSKHETTSV